MAEQGNQQIGHYQILRRLGHGGTADVYLGEHIFLKTQAAIKLLHASLPEHDVPALLQEARVIAGLKHPNIIRVLDFGVQNEAFYLVMDYAPQGTLRQNYPSGTRLAPALVTTLITQIASALQYAHDQHVIHCDIKPENILLSQQNMALLSDFGISIVLQTMTAQQLQHIAGTLAYMAPEQFAGKPQRASDQYALAVMTYELLSGTRPFSGNFAALSSQHLHTPIPPLSEKVAGLPSDLDQVIAIATEKDPARRFESVSAFARAFEQACQPLSTGNALTSHEIVPTILATIAPAPLPTPPSLQAGFTQEHTLESRQDTPFAQRRTDPGTSLRAYQALVSQRKPARSLSRRTLVLGGTVVVGAALVVTAFNKLPALLTPPPAHSATRTHPTPHTSTTLNAAQTPQATTPSTSNIPLGSTLITYTGQSQDVTGICWSPTSVGRLLASCSQDGSAAIWNATTGQTTQTFSNATALNTITWSPNGRLLAFADNAGMIQVHNVHDGSLVATCSGHSQPIRGLAWAPDSQRLVSSSEDQTAIVWNALNGTSLFTYTRHTGSVWAVAWAPNGSAIATGSWDSTVHIWRPQDGTLLTRYSAAQPVRAVDWSPDSSLLASGGDEDSVQIWQASNGTIRAVYREHHDHIEAVQWSPNGQTLASASADKTAQIWQASNANRLYTYTGHSGLVWTLAWSPDGQFIATGSSDGTAKVWQATTP